MCDVCSDFLQLLVSYEAQICNESEEHPHLSKYDISTLLLYVQTWPARQCMCCYRDFKNLDRFSLLTQGVICLCVQHLKNLRSSLVDNNKGKSKDENEKKKDVDTKKDSPDSAAEDSQENFTLQDKEKLFHLVSKIFLMNFPLYVASKHTIQTKLEEVTSLELTSLNSYCDLHDQEIPIYLLRNVTLFCKTGGLHAMTLCFQHLLPDILPVSTAHAIIAIVCNLKLWLNFKTTLQLLVPLRSRVLRYMCRLADSELRTPAIKSMADFMWSAIKDPLDMPLGLDSDGLDLAFKYFTSSTLTMRLAGIAQINNHIGLLAELCGNSGTHSHDMSLSSDAVDSAPRSMADWLINNNIISHIFGPNLHVELIKQSHIILNFLAMEGRITTEYLDMIWAAAQLKHCSKPVHDLLPSLIKHLSVNAALHLYNLLTKLETREHTEQTLYLASALIKFIWTRSGASSATSDPSHIGFVSSSTGMDLHKCASSSENSVSIDGSNSDEEQGETSAQSESHKSGTEAEEEEEVDEEEEDEDEEMLEIEREGPTPCKQPRTQHNTFESGNTKEENQEKKSKGLHKKKISGVGGESNTARNENSNNISANLPEGVETIASSSSADEDDIHHSHMIKKRHVRQKSLKCKRQEECVPNRRRACGDLLPEGDESDAETKQLKRLSRVKSRSRIREPLVSVYVGDSSSGSENGKALIRSIGPRIPSCQSYIPDLDVPRDEHLLELLSGDEIEGDADGSYSSRMSNKSEKNMGDFDGEESVCEEELAQLAAQAQEPSPQCLGFQQHDLEKTATWTDPRLSATFKIDNVCQPGNTLLWDLLQDNKINQLGEGLALEAEKALCNLLCYNTERIIRMKFIEGCLQNLANNWSVVISLRILPKLLASFQQFRGLDTHHVTHWADKQHNMMAHFFNNLKVYTNSRKAKNSPTSPTNNLYTHQMEVQVRLHFLSAVYSPLGSPKSFKLSVEQVDTLWNCLAHDSECSDELFSWLLSQAKSGDQHALGLEAMKRLYLTHLPTLPPENLSPTCLALFQQLCSLARNNSSNIANSQQHGVVHGMDYLWKVALRANNTDVSMAAIQYLNNYYLGQRLQYESEFVSQCMMHLSAAVKDLALPTPSEDAPLLRIQRALLLLKTHLETFKKKYAYHLRRWTIQGQGIGSHGTLERSGTPLRILIQLAGMSERTPLDVLSTNFVAELRAEATHIWEITHAKTQSSTSSEGNGVLGSLLHDGSIRMITQGQELTTDFDEKTLQELGFKDNQMIFISIGANRSGHRKKDSSEPPSLQQPPPRDSVPMLLLLRPTYFEQLFDLMHTLSAMKTQVKGGNDIPHTKAQVLSRRVWDILTMIPTNPTLMEGFQHLNVPLDTLLNPASPQKLMYSLHIVESLSSKRFLGTGGGSDNGTKQNLQNWSQTFRQNGGLRHLFDIFISGVLQRSNGDESEWLQDCLAMLLKLLNQLGVHNAEVVPRSKSDKLLIPTLNEDMLLLMDVQTTMSRLMSILRKASLPRDPNHYKTGFWGRSQVVHYAMALLVSWLHCSEESRMYFFQTSQYESWLEKLVLDEPEPSVRREVCAALYRLCLGTTIQDGDSNVRLAAPMLNALLVYLSKAESMHPQKQESLHHIDDGKEPYGPACRDYFWLICRLVDGLSADNIRESQYDVTTDQVDINSLCKKVSESIISREYLELRHRTIEDDGLIGLLNFMANLLKHRPPFQTSKEGKQLLLEVFEYLFALPTPRQRHVPKCKSTGARAAAFDLLVELVKGAPENYELLHEKLLAQHKPGPHSPYPWDYWPHDDGRSESGYVGLTNLGATCYMASCMQHLYMMPQARASILSADCTNSKHEPTLRELQRMFAYLLESERKAYNPRSFCKVYTMDHQPLNTGEQKDMAEFFIDLVSKLEEMTPELKKVVKTLFCGVLSNNVVSLDCQHVSRTLEEFYTVRCQVADMRNLYESLDEVTVKDTLEGDNMYTCSQCGKKVRAEKRACFKKLPRILCFNTMRYTFNMVTMLKEKVNTHFSFPLRLNMAGYVEKQLMPQQYQEERDKDSDSNDKMEHYEYDLIGVTVHTGTADGGHYYSFIKDRSSSARDKWLLFNDAEVKPFDPNQIASECFGGEMTSKTYDSVTDKFMDFSFEKTNSAYMLFYEHSQRNSSEECPPSTALGYTTPSENDTENHSTSSANSEHNYTIELNKELEEWIWKDNMHFIQDKNIFEHTYFNFMWQMCGYIPQSLLHMKPNVTQQAAQLSTSFFMETFIHAKEKPTMVQWVELVTKQFNACQEACEWFLEHMAADTWWPIQVLIKCPNQMVRQMFQRLCIHVIQRLRQSQAPLYLLVDDEDCDNAENTSPDPERIGNKSCVTKFVKSLLSLMEHGAKAHLKHLTEYFGFLYEFCRMGDEETKFLLSVRAIHSMVNFYLGHKAHDFVDESDGEDDDEVIALPTDKYKPASLDKMIALIAMMVEKSRDSNQRLTLSSQDYAAIAGGKGFPFLYQQIKDNINLQQTRNLIHSLCRGNERLASLLVNMLAQAISRHPEACQPFFKMLTLLTEGNNNNNNNNNSNNSPLNSASGSSGLPCFTQLVLQRVWETAECCPHSALDWLSVQVARSKLVHQWVLQSVDQWLEHFLIGHSNQRVRSAAAFLMVSLIPSSNFRQGFRARGTRGEPILTPEALTVLHQVYTTLLRLLGPAKHYTDIQTHGTNKLTAYFALMTYCVISRTEKLMFGQYFMQLWHLFHPKLSEPSVPAHHNKQALLAFWHHVCTDCPENVQLMLHNAHVTKNIAFNYILADHDDQEVVMFNRVMLPAYYGLLRLCCQQSHTFTRHLASHQNLQWAFKNITPHPTQYSAAVDELFKLMALFVMKHPDTTEQELREINTFRRNTLSAYLQCLDGRTGWPTLISAFRMLIDTDEDRLYVLYNGGLQLIFESIITLHVMYHEATACNVSSELLELLSICLELVRCFRQNRSSTTDASSTRSLLLSCKDWLEALRKLATLLNTYNPPEMRSLCIDLLKELCLMAPADVMQVLVPLLSHCHAAFQDTHNAVPLGPYFPRRGMAPIPSITKSARPLRPMVQMAVPHNQLEIQKGNDPEYDRMLQQFYGPYHEFIDVLCRVAVNNECLNEVMVSLSAMVGFEAVPLHSTYFPKLWLDILRSQHIDRKYITILTSCNYFVDYVDAVLLDERAALSVDVIYDFLVAFFPKVASHVLTEQTCNLIESLVKSLVDTIDDVNVRTAAYRLAGDLRALLLVYSAAPHLLVNQAAQLVAPLQTLSDKINAELSSLDQSDSKTFTPSKKRKRSNDDNLKSPEHSKTVADTSDSATKPKCSKENNRKDDSVSTAETSSGKKETTKDKSPDHTSNASSSSSSSSNNSNNIASSRAATTSSTNTTVPLLPQNTQQLLNSSTASDEKKDSSCSMMDSSSDNVSFTSDDNCETAERSNQNSRVVFNLKLLQSVISELVVLIEKCEHL